MTRIFRNQDQMVQCPVCLAKMVAPWRKGWLCRGCGSHGIYLGTDLAVESSPDWFDYANVRGRRKEVLDNLTKSRLETAGQ